MAALNKLKYYLKKNKAWYKADFKLFVAMSRNQCEDFEVIPNFPCIKERNTDSGVANGAYFHQDLYMAQQIFNNTPQKHVDIGSRIDGFVAHIATFRNIEVFDIRPLESKTQNIIFRQADFMSQDCVFEQYCDSISSLHAIEHFGLGRYGDSIDPLGHIKGVDNISKMLIKGGLFYFSVPMGPSRIEFNAHRIFSMTYLLDWLSPKFDIIRFAYIDDLGDIHENILLDEHLTKTNCGCNHGCALLVLRKK